jgi:hypothetical protein
VELGWAMMGNLMENCGKFDGDLMKIKEAR